MELQTGSYGSPRWSTEILDCAMPMTFDTYSNCAHQCSYCFAYFQRAIGDAADAYLHHMVRSVDVEKVKRMFIDPDKYAGQFAWYIKRKMVLQWGGLSDGFDYYEKKFGKSLELLRFFREIDYPVSISTKGVWYVNDPKYREVLKDAKNVHFKLSIICTDKEKAAKLEQGVASPLERFTALKMLRDLGIGATTTRFRPFVIGVSDVDMEDMFKMSAWAGVYSLTTEWLCIEKRASNSAREKYKIISEACGFDVFDFYMKNSFSGSGLLRLNYDIKRENIDKMVALAAHYGIQFFVSDAHHKEVSHSAGCCGLPDTGPLSNINRGQYAEAVLIAKKNNKVLWSDIGGQAAVLKNVPFYAADGFNASTEDRAKRRYMSMYDYMRDQWNNPKSWQSPARYFGGALVPSGRDGNGDIIYLYNRPFIENGEHVESVSELAIKLGMSGKAKAEMYDARTADGTDWGHVAFPVYVISKGRHLRATTPSLLSESRINHTLVVSNLEADLYREAFPNSDVMETPAGIVGLAETRQWLLEYCRAERIEAYWLLDDDVSAFYRWENNTRLHVPARRALSKLEELSGQYANVGIIGLNNINDAEVETEFSVNRIVHHVMLIYSGLVFSNYRIDRNAYGDESFQLDMLSKGELCTIQYNQLAYETPERGALAGGLSSYYLQKTAQYNPALSEVEQIQAQYAHYCVVDKTRQWPVLNVDFRKFFQPLLPSGLEQYRDLAADESASLENFVPLSELTLDE